MTEQTPSNDAIPEGDTSDIAQQLSKPFEMPKDADESPPAPPPAIASYVQTGQESIDFTRDVRWAYGSLGSETVSASDAPSGAAWHLLQYGKTARSEFIKFAMAFFTKEDKKKADDESLFDDHKKQMKFIDQLRDEMVGVSQDMMDQASDEALLAMIKKRGLTLDTSDTFGA
jgi:hypothetical protein